MVSLDLSFKELLSFLRRNVKKWPKFLDGLSCEGSRLHVDIPRKNEEDEIYPPVPVEGTLELDGKRFILVAGSGDIKRVASLVFTTEELACFLRKNLKKWPPVLDSLEYDQVHNHFRFTVEARSKEAGKKPPFDPDIHVLSRILSPGEGLLRVRSTTE